MIILVKLLLAHFLGDFLFQPQSWVENKEKKKLKSGKFFLHILIHCGLIFLFLWDITLWPLALSVTISHFLIDMSKLYLSRSKTRVTWFILDQVLHLISIFTLWYFWTSQNFNLSGLVENAEFWLYLCAAFFVTVPSGIIIKIFLLDWSEKLMVGNDESLSNAGKYIGILERLFVFMFVLAGHWEAVGFLLAAKSVFRFGDLKESKDRKLTEYILIGTLLSFGIAISTALLVKHLIN